MIEELNEFLIRKGWTEDAAEDVSEIHYESESESDWRDRISKEFAWMNDKEHDYVGELCRDVIAWEVEVGER